MIRDERRDGQIQAIVGIPDANRFGAVPCEASSPSRAAMTADDERGVPNEYHDEQATELFDTLVTEVDDRWPPA